MLRLVHARASTTAPLRGRLARASPAAVSHLLPGSSSRSGRGVGRVPAPLRPAASYHFCTCVPRFSSNPALAEHPTRRNSSGELVSQVSGPLSPPLSSLSLAAFWAELVAAHASRPALISAHEPPDAHASLTREKQAGEDECLRWTFAEMDAHIRQVARGLRSMGVKPGDRVAVLMMNCSAMAALQLSTAYLGAPLVTLNPSYSPRELARALKHVGASTLLIVPSLRGSDYTAHLRAILPSLATPPQSEGQELQDEALPLLKRIVLVDNISGRPAGWEATSLLAHEAKGFEEAKGRLNGWAHDYKQVLKRGEEEGESLPGLQMDMDEVVNLQLTSGTTGAPKAVALSSHNLTNNAASIGATLNLSPSDILVNVPPLFHCFGLTLGNLAAWSRGASVLYVSEGFDALRTLRAAAREQASAINGVPAHFVAELALLRQVRAAQRKGDHEAVQGLGVQANEKWEFKLRTGLMSGSTIPIELMHACIDELGAEQLTVVYGMTETSPVSFGVDTSASIERRCSTVGRIYPWAHAKIVSPSDDSGTPLPVGQTGELWSGGYLVMQGYFHDPEKTKEAVLEQDGVRWMKTGDLASMDEEGYVQIRGRVKDLVIRGGENLFPPMIENCIDELPAVATSAVVAVPDERMGETVGVFIQLESSSASDCEQPTPASVRAHVKEHLSHQSAPDWVWFLGRDGVAAEMPATASGKVQKVVLREWAADLVKREVGRATKAKA